MRSSRRAGRRATSPSAAGRACRAWRSPRWRPRGSSRGRVGPPEPAAARVATAGSGDRPYAGARRFLWRAALALRVVFVVADVAVLSSEGVVDVVSPGYVPDDSP